mmetsp:Transcript_14700/g.29686  ORF Transcript_14700/g.29686 Transcript_14700/m.29686 type:complete len:118 (-) Transcript_14700:473-826(-)
MSLFSALFSSSFDYLVHARAGCTVCCSIGWLPVASDARRDSEKADRMQTGNQVSSPKQLAWHVHEDVEEEEDEKRDRDFSFSGSLTDRLCRSISLSTAASEGERRGTELRSTQCMHA